MVEGDTQLKTREQIREEAVKGLAKTFLEHPVTSDIFEPFAQKVERFRSVSELLNFTVDLGLEQADLERIGYVVALAAPMNREGRKAPSALSQEIGRALLVSELPVPNWYQKEDDLTPSR